MPILGKYTLLTNKGQGAYATVCKVRHDEYKYIRAVKILNQPILYEKKDPMWIKFRDECEVLLRIGNGNHPNIVHIYEPQLYGTQAYVELDYIDGRDLTHIIKESPFVKVEEVIKLAIDISSALAYCHVDIFEFCLDRNEDNLDTDPNDGAKVIITPQKRKELIKKYRVIHNDIHSGNIMRRNSGDYILLDFGLSVNGADVIKSSQHKNGAIEYKAPEKWSDQRDADTITAATDIYSFGVVLYEYLTGIVPFPCDPGKQPHIVAHEVGEAHKNKPVPPIFEMRQKCFVLTHPGESYDTPDYPQWLEEMINRCLSKNPNERFHDGKELHDFVMEHVRQNDPARRLAELENKHNEAQRTIENFKWREKDLKSEIFVLHSHEDARTKDLEEHKRLVLKQKKEIALANEELAKSEAKVSALQSEISSLKKNLNADQIAVAAKKDVDILRAQLNEERKKHSDLKKEFDFLEKLHKKLDEENHKLDEENRSLLAKVKDNPQPSKSRLIFVVITAVFCLVIGLVLGLFIGNGRHVDEPQMVEQPLVEPSPIPDQQYDDIKKQLDEALQQNELLKTQLNDAQRDADAAAEKQSNADDNSKELAAENNRLNQQVKEHERTISSLKDEVNKQKAEITKLTNYIRDVIK